MRGLGRNSTPASPPLPELRYRGEGMTAFLHRLSTPEGRRRGNRALLGVCAAGFVLSDVLLGWDRWFFLLMLWTGAVYVPLRLALEWLGAAGRTQRRHYRAGLPDRITPANLPVAAQAIYDREVLMPRIVTPPFVEKVHEAVVGIAARSLPQDPEGIRRAAVRFAAVADGWMAELAAVRPDDPDAQNIQARWRDIRLLASLMAVTRVLAVLYEETSRQPFYGPGLTAGELRAFCDEAMEFLDRAALQPEMPAWRGTLLGLWTPEVQPLRERWEAFCEVRGPAPRRLEAILEAVGA